MAKLAGGAPKGEEMQAFIACVPSAALQQLNDDSSVRKVRRVGTMPGGWPGVTKSVDRCRTSTHDQQ